MRIGCHLSIEDGIDVAIQNSIEYGGSAVQVFLSPNRGAGPGKVILKETAETIKAILKNTGIYFVVHGKYILNFCSPTILWYNDALIADLRKASQLGENIGVVIHQGKNKPEFNLTRTQAIETYVRSLEAVLEETNDLKNPIILENSCQQGNEIGYTIEELAEIYHTFDKKYQNRVKFCIDTCHIFVAGTLQFLNEEEVDNFFMNFENLIGMDKLEVIHFNDSKTPFDGHNDHHHDLMSGYITDPQYQSEVKKYNNTEQSKRGTLEGIKRLISWAKTYNIPLILETPREKSTCEDQIKLLNQWAEEAPNIDTKKPKLITKKIVMKKK